MKQNWTVWGCQHLTKVIISQGGNEFSTVIWNKTEQSGDVNISQKLSSAKEEMNWAQSYETKLNSLGMSTSHKSYHQPRRKWIEHSHMKQNWTVWGCQHLTKVIISQGGNELSTVMWNKTEQSGDVNISQKLSSAKEEINWAQSYETKLNSVGMSTSHKSYHQPRRK